MLRNVLWAGKYIKIFCQLAKTHAVDIQFIQPGKPAQNGYIERFNRSYREAILDMYLFENIFQFQ